MFVLSSHKHTREKERSPLSEVSEANQRREKTNIWRAVCIGYLAILNMHDLLEGSRAWILMRQQNGPIGHKFDTAC